MYSKIPIGQAQWTEENMKYAMCFFPLIGVVIGACVFGWSYLSEYLRVGNLLQTVIYVLIPIIITGGIHMDGFLDTSDALNSYQSKERKLEILKDSNAGAFAVITGIGYFLLAGGVWSEVNKEIILILVFSFIISRAFSGLSVVTFQMAKDTGLATTFSSQAQKKTVKWVMIGYLFLASIAIVLINPLLGLCSMIASGLVFIYYRYKAYKEFGGITGDLAGFFLQVCELTIAAVVVFGYLVVG